MSNEAKNPNDEYLKKLEKHAEHLRLVRYYSIQRIDLLIISLSGVGIYTCFEILKYIDSHEIFKKYPEVDDPFNFCGILFTVAIISNFLSQWTAYKGSGHALESTKTDIYTTENENELDEQKKSEQSEKSEKQDKLSKIYNKVTEITNLISNGLMLLGLLILTLSFLHLF
ncbi:MAG: hypothetical protein JNL60_09385 [Bacteroidia bacterium]|nr:hypothetical protein [Bacteroidia bacterium]